MTPPSNPAGAVAWAVMSRVGTTVATYLLLERKEADSFALECTCWRRKADGPFYVVALRPIEPLEDAVVEAAREVIAVWRGASRPDHRHVLEQALRALDGEEKA